MVHADEFESQFKRASKTPFVPEDLHIKSILFVLDCKEDDSWEYVEAMKGFFSCVMEPDTTTSIHCSILPTERSDNVADVLEGVREQEPDLVVTRRHLFKEPREALPGLGLHVDVLTQGTPTPVMLIPRISPTEFREQFQNTDAVMVASDNLSQDNHLVNYGVLFTESNGRLYLVDMENDCTFERYMGVIEKIPNIESAMAREEIQAQLFKEAEDFSNDCIAQVSELKPSINIQGIVRFGHTVGDYRKLLSQYNIDLLIFNTKEESQLAMSGLAYSMAVEFSHLPLLML